MCVTQPEIEVKYGVVNRFTTFSFVVGVVIANSLRKEQKDCIGFVHNFNHWNLAELERMQDFPSSYMYATTYSTRDTQSQPSCRNAGFDLGTPHHVNFHHPFKWPKLLRFTQPISTQTSPIPSISPTTGDKSFSSYLVYLAIGYDGLGKNEVGVGLIMPFVRLAEIQMAILKFDEMEL
ncbi:hypothetical protein GQ44DRAFT_721543 [Phaeosphaeriaceae sp. PMI808]|nr:hypothetical protein GQ44DRAFT_721543 [Phaeosphaeriaceae sp. PMI808]